MEQQFDRSRRRVLAGSLSALGVLATVPLARLYAAELTRTPAQTAGPFYPTSIPLDSDNDLVMVKGQADVAKGEVSNVIGRVLDKRGRPISRARIEIWQCDANGRYHHPWDRRNVPVDPNFQGYGQFITQADAAYRFRTIKPVPYPGRAPHIHFKISGPGIEPLITQMYVAGASENAGDWILNRINDARARQSLIVKFAPHSQTPGELLARFDIVLIADGRFAKS
ncbi:MAG: intradiol ring-cleavage dioxygenase [Acidiferrobacterales bacterium]